MRTRLLLSVTAILFGGAFIIGNHHGYQIGIEPDGSVQEYTCYRDGYGNCVSYSRPLDTPLKGPCFKDSYGDCVD